MVVQNKHPDIAWKPPIPLKHLPPKLSRKVCVIIQSLSAGSSYFDHHGKRLVAMGQRKIISIPVESRYRLIRKDRSGSIRFVEVLTYEKYNNKLSAGGWS